MPPSRQTTTSDIDNDLEERLCENGFSAEQIHRMKTTGIQKALITPMLDARLSRDQIEKVYTVITELEARLPRSASYNIYHHDDDIPTIASYVRNLPVEDSKLVGAIYQSLKDETYIFDMGRGFVQLRSIYKNGTS